jgi:hypothetical protein
VLAQSLIKIAVLALLMAPRWEAVSSISTRIVTCTLRVDPSGDLDTPPVPPHMVARERALARLGTVAKAVEI